MLNMFNIGLLLLKAFKIRVGACRTAKHIHCIVDGPLDIVVCCEYKEAAALDQHRWWSLGGGKLVGRTVCSIKYIRTVT